MKVLFAGVLGLITSSVLANSTTGTDRQLIIPNTYRCTVEDGARTHNLIITDSQMKFDNAPTTLSKPEESFTMFGTLITAFDLSIVDAKRSFSVIIPQVYLSGISKNHTFETQMISSLSSGFFPGPIAGVGISNSFYNTVCNASYVSQGSEDLNEDATRIISTKTDYINMMPGPGVPYQLPKYADVTVEAEVISTGCTTEMDFEAKIITEVNGKQLLFIKRINPDNCEATKHPINVELRAKDFATTNNLHYKGQKIDVKIQIAH